MAPSAKSCKEMLSSYCTLFPLKVKEFEAFDSVFSVLRATCCNGHLYLCKIEKIDFLKICQEEGFY